MMGLVGFTSMICSHFHLSSSTANYPGAGMAPPVLVPLTAPVPLEPWPRHTGWDTILPSECVLLPRSWKGIAGGRDTRFEMYGVRGQFVEISSGV